ncbi:MAG: hypothetical protein ACOYOO_14545, partial [Saprospiraceae bacterium]
GGCVKRFFTALRAELYFERHVIFTISLREIVKMTCRSEENSAAAGGKRLFTQPPSKDNLARSATKRLIQNLFQRIFQRFGGNLIAANAGYMAKL